MTYVGCHKAVSCLAVWVLSVLEECSQSWGEVALLGEKYCYEVEQQFLLTTLLIQCDYTSQETWATAFQCSWGCVWFHSVGCSKPPNNWNKQFKIVSMSRTYLNLWNNLSRLYYVKHSFTNFAFVPNGTKLHFCPLTDMKFSLWSPAALSCLQCLVEYDVRKLLFNWWNVKSM